MVLSPGAVLRPPPEELNAPVRSTPPRSRTLAEAEREHILQILEQTEWVVGGPNGAAVQLGRKRTTLLHKMRRLAISRPGT
jgi:transcriptional regulator with GAF, ATPase, and Fis domain